MQIGILGAGKIGGTLGRKLAATGHEVLMGIRDPQSPKAQSAQAEGVRFGSLAEAAEFGEAVIIALPFAAAQESLPSINLAEKLVIDTTNAFGGLPGGFASAGAAIAAWSRSPRVIKAWNATPWEALANPVYGNVRVETFVCGDDAPAKATVMELVGETGLIAVDVGGLERAPLTESFARLWAAIAYGMGTRHDFAFKLVSR